MQSVEKWDRASVVRAACRTARAGQRRTLAFLRNAVRLCPAEGEAATEWFERNPPPPGGGRASSGGCCYHLSFRSGSRTGGACAGAAHAYIARTDEYADPERDAAVYVES